MKRNPSKLANIANQVLAREQISSTSEDFSLRSKRFTEHGNFNPLGFSATKPMVDYMVLNKDPRLPIFYQKLIFSRCNKHISSCW